MSQRRIVKELQESQLYPIDGILLVPEGDNFNQLKALIAGPENTVYAEGLFHLKVRLTDYPFKSPIIKFITKIYHPNVNTDGTMGFSEGYSISFGDNWSPNLRIVHMLEAMRALLIEPNPVEAIVREIGHQYLNNRGQFDEKAKYWCVKYAKFNSY